MVTFVPFAQTRINKMVFFFFLFFSSFFSPRYKPPDPHHGNVSSNFNLKSGLSKKIR